MEVSQRYKIPTNSQTISWDYFLFNEYAYGMKSEKLIYCFYS